ncbi:hypothetical protein VM98_09160 [Streptomyces rubellomurinus subsp. indigoferus]|uniref:Uncharacterized protein n=1 Tax=Streptomyces rubellomurinus (strain ATCC 31215) TaxID=359131 RepID=A0A0F2TGI3_STRR3|nr:hypothetical protein [Streptomyces rubellomurinus]KJS56101.1 hypothetical protein VM98_09160 [Streptomyces rubellomurinus subsp. indigoferus]KJS61651.1 hypothetical protein VM95_13790 [Streptomyces rubellomurinus]
MGDRETWTSVEFGGSHRGWAGVLVADGSVPRPVYFSMMSGGDGHSVSQWSVYDGRHGRPRAAALRAVCACGWSGPERRLDWEEFGEEELDVAGYPVAELCEQDWDDHLEDVDRSTLPLPETVACLLRQLEEEIDTLRASSPLAAVRAARKAEVVVQRAVERAARDVGYDMDLDDVAAALGLDDAEAKQLLIRLGRRR